MDSFEVLELHKHGKSKEAFRFSKRVKPTLKVGQILIDVRTFGLNYADVLARNGLYASAPPLPSVLGYEVVGTVEEVHESVNEFKIGDRVLAFTLFGGYAKKAITNEQTTVLLSPEIDDATAAALATQYCTAFYSAVQMANLQANETVLIHAAAGGVGTALTQLAKWKGCRVVGTVGSDSKLKYIQHQGVDVGINYRKTDYKNTILNELGEQAIDVSFNPIGGVSFRKDKSLLNFGGRMILLGVSTWSNKKGNTLDKLKLAYDFGLIHPIQLLLKSIGVIGVNMLHVAQSKPHIIKECMSSLIQLHEAKIIKPHIGGIFTQSKFFEAHDALEDRTSIGKLVVSWE